MKSHYRTSRGYTVLIWFFVCPRLTVENVRIYRRLYLVLIIVNIVFAVILHRELYDFRANEGEITSGKSILYFC